MASEMPQDAFSSAGWYPQVGGHRHGTGDVRLITPSAFGERSRGPDALDWPEREPPALLHPSVTERGGPGGGAGAGAARRRGSRIPPSRDVICDGASTAQPRAVPIHREWRGPRRERKPEDTPSTGSGPRHRISPHCAKTRSLAAPVTDTPPSSPRSLLTSGPRAGGG
jgi:hypothetical protein